MKLLAGALQWFALLLVAWGALAFGSVYPWTYWPLAAASAFCGLLGLFVRVDGQEPAVSRGLIAALGAFAAAALVQLVPLPIEALAALSPAAPALLKEWNLAFAAGLLSSHPLTVSPKATWTGLALFGSFAILLVGLTRALSSTGCRWFVERLTVFAALLALLGIVQKSIWGRPVYGFWMPLTGANPFGPFINKNHFAGWMLMALPLTLALVYGEIARGMQGVRPRWRDRLLWLDSPEANRLLRLAAVAILMALALALTMSRSGISTLAGAMLIVGIVMARRRHSTGRKAAGLAYLVLLAVVVVSWVGADVIGSRFSQANWSALNNRLGPWSDALRVARAFPLAGSGLNTYGITMLFYQRYAPDWHYQEAHNDYLQLVAEGGLLLGVPALVALGIFVRDVRRRVASDDGGLTASWLRVGAVTALLAIALQETVEFSLQMPGNAVLFAVVAAIALHRPPPLPPRPRREAVRPEALRDARRIGSDTHASGRSGSSGSVRPA